MCVGLYRKAARAYASYRLYMHELGDLLGHSIAPRDLHRRRIIQQSCQYHSWRAARVRLDFPTRPKSPPPLPQTYEISIFHRCTGVWYDMLGIIDKIYGTNSCITNPY